MALELAVILLLVAANGLFAGAEISTIAVRKTRIDQLVEERAPGARALAALRAEPERFLATVQIGITVVSAAAAAFSGATIAARLAPLLSALGAPSPWAEDAALALVVAGVSYLSLVFGELVPKSLALRHAERYARLAARPLAALAWLTRPVVRLLTATSNLVLRPFGDATSFSEARLSPEELQQLVDDAARTGALDPRTGEIASRALAFGGLRAVDVMVPRNRVVALPRGATPEQIRQTLLERGHDRMPVIGASGDDVLGYVTAGDVLALGWQEDLLVLEDILRPALFVPESAGAAKVLRDLQDRRLWLAVVVDEHGGVSGIVTLEDLLEELVGELFRERETPPDTIVPEPGGAALVRGDVAVREVNRALSLDLPEEGDFTTVAGLCIALAGGIPEAGARLRAGAALLEVVDATPRQVRKVRVRPAPPEAAAPGRG
jgi:putative hemolysin